MPTSTFRSHFIIAVKLLIWVDKLKSIRAFCIFALFTSALAIDFIRDYQQNAAGEYSQFASWTTSREK